MRSCSLRLHPTDASHHIVMQHNICLVRRNTGQRKHFAGAPKPRADGGFAQSSVCCHGASVYAPRPSSPAAAAVVSATHAQDSTIAADQNRVESCGTFVEECIACTQRWVDLLRDYATRGIYDVVSLPRDGDSLHRLAACCRANSVVGAWGASRRQGLAPSRGVFAALSPLALAILQF